jgi:hypothetical protein
MPIIQVPKRSKPAYLENNPIIIDYFIAKFYIFNIFAPLIFYGLKRLLNKSEVVKQTKY